MKNRYRKTIVAGNWKMNKTPSETRAFFEAILPMAGKPRCDVVFCVPFTNIQTAFEALKGTSMAVGAQNMHFWNAGAYTGEITGAMLAESGAKYVILGHSERRQGFQETDETVNLKMHAAHTAGLIPILCVGETQDQREKSLMDEHIGYQVKAALAGLEPAEAKKTVIAYEPIWAIGTGLNATADEAQEVCKLIRDVVRELYGGVVSRAVSVLYGGSMNASNAQSLLSMPDIDGGLIGGASLRPAELMKIIQVAEENR